MGWQDRQYNQSEPSRFSAGGYGGGNGGGQRIRFGGGFNKHSAVTWLIAINAIIFLLDGILTGSQRAGTLSPIKNGNFNIEQAINGLQLWRFFTYQFLHADFFHIFFNMLALYFFGHYMENWWGTRRFIVFYIFSGFGSVIVFSLFILLFPGFLGATVQSPLVGASGCIFGVLVGAAMVAPNQRVMLLFPPIPMQLKTMVYFFLGMAVLKVLAGSRNDGGEAAHLGGAAIGFLLMKAPRLLDFADGRFIANWKANANRRGKERDAKREYATQQEIDRILKKVSDHGLQSLTDKEKATLQRATDDQRRAG